MLTLQTINKTYFDPQAKGKTLINMAHAYVSSDHLLLLPHCSWYCKTCNVSQVSPKTYSRLELTDRDFIDSCVIIYAILLAAFSTGLYCKLLL